MYRESTKTKVSFGPMSSPSREGSLHHIESCKERWQRSSRSTSSPQGHRLHGRVAASACLEYQPNRTAKCSSVPSTTRARRPYSGSGKWAPSRISLRIGGATALLAAGADPIHIKTMGRWSSDCWRLYVRACFEQTVQWTRRLGSQQVHDVQGSYETLAQEVDEY